MNKNVFFFGIFILLQNCRFHSSSNMLQKERKHYPNNVELNNFDIKKIIVNNEYSKCLKLLNGIDTSSKQSLLNTKIEYDGKKYYPIIVAIFEANMKIIKLFNYHNPKKDILNNFLFNGMSLIHLSIYTKNYEMFYYLFYMKNIPLMSPISFLAAFNKDLHGKKNVIKSKIAKHILDFIVECKPGLFNNNDIIDSINHSFYKRNLPKDITSLVTLYCVRMYTPNNTINPDDEDPIGIDTISKLLGVCNNNYYRKNELADYCFALSEKIGLKSNSIQGILELLEHSHCNKILHVEELSDFEC